jgi:hypothetical protein
LETVANDRSSYAWRPLVLDAAAAHAAGQVRYDDNGCVTLQHATLGPPVTVGLDRQYPCVLPTFLSLDKALSSASNSPRLRSGKSLREAFDIEYRAYLEQLARTQASSEGWEPGYGSYVYDRRTGDLYVVAPRLWHRLALVCSNAKLLTDPQGSMTAEEIRERLSSTVVGFVGASLGSNVVEGVMREMRPQAAKLADPDYLEATNLNRLQHSSLRYLSHARAARRNPKNACETRFVSNVELVA